MFDLRVLWRIACVYCQYNATVLVIRVARLEEWRSINRSVRRQIIFLNAIIPCTIISISSSRFISVSKGRLFIAADISRAIYSYGNQSDTGWWLYIIVSF